MYLLKPTSTCRMWHKVNLKWILKVWIQSFPSPWLVNEPSLIRDLNSGNFFWCLLLHHKCYLEFSFMCLWVYLVFPSAYSVLVYYGHTKTNVLVLGKWGHDYVLFLAPYILLPLKCCQHSFKSLWFCFWYMQPKKETKKSICLWRLYFIWRWWKNMIAKMLWEQ